MASVTGIICGLMLSVGGAGAPRVDAPPGGLSSDDRTDAWLPDIRVDLLRLDIDPRRRPTLIVARLTNEGDHAFTIMPSLQRTALPFSLRATRGDSVWHYVAAPYVPSHTTVDPPFGGLASIEPGNSIHIEWRGIKPRGHWRCGDARRFRGLITTDSRGVQHTS